VNEKRRLPRKRPDGTVHVTDSMTGEVVGHIGNLSMEGMLMLAQRPIVSDALYQLAFHLPDAHGQLHPVEFGAQEQWSEPGTMRGQFWVGFRFIDGSEDDQGVLDEWLLHAADFVD
jgi:hypothetical protein